MRTWNKRIGILKSRIIYDFKPFNRRRLARFYSSFIGDGDLCFDIGAHTGNRTAAWLKLGAKVVAVEPHPAFADLLFQKFNSNPHFKLVTKAVGYGKTSCVLKVSSLYPMVSTLSNEWMKLIKSEKSSVEWDEGIHVHVLQLDDLISEFGLPHFCKIDVEGLEEEALSGLSSPIRALSFEFFPLTPERTIRCLQSLESLGIYEYNWSEVEKLRLQSDSWLSFGRIKTVMETYQSKRPGDIYARLKTERPLTA
jgi:FkbM family methyltransferase